MRYLYRSDPNKSVHDIVKHSLVFSRHDVHQIHSVWLNNLVTLIHTPGKRGESHQVGRHFAPLAAHAGVHVPYLALSSGEILKNFNCSKRYQTCEYTYFKLAFDFALIFVDYRIPSPDVLG